MELEINHIWILFPQSPPPLPYQYASAHPPPPDLHLVGGKIATDIPYLSSFSFFFFPFLSSFHFPSLPSFSFMFAGGGQGHFGPTPLHTLLAGLTATDLPFFSTFSFFFLFFVPF